MNRRFTMLITEAPRAIHQFLHGFKADPNPEARRRDQALYAPAGGGGRHQVTYLGKHGDFHLYSAVNVHDPDEGIGLNPERAAAADPEALKAHLSKVHTVDEINDRRNKAREWSVAHETDDGVQYPPHLPVFHDQHVPVLGEDQPTVIAAAHEATRQLRSLGLPAQSRHVVLFDQSDQLNHNTGGKDVGGHWDSRNHVIAVNRKGSWTAGGGDHIEAARILTHEWAHAFHDEMSKPQRAAWRDFYHRHVVKGSAPSGSEDDRQGFIKDFAEHYLAHPNVRSFGQSVKARENAQEPNADMMQSAYRSTPMWWEGMLSGNHLGSGVVAQTSHTLHHSADEQIGLKKGVIRKNANVVVRSVDPEHPRDRHMMSKNYWAKEDAAHLLAIHPVGHPEKLAIVHRANLLNDASAGSKHGTYLRVNPEKTAEMSNELVRGQFKRSGDVLSVHGDQTDAAEHYRLSKSHDAAPQTFPMGQEWKDQSELSGSDFKTKEALAKNMKERNRTNNLDLATDDTVSLMAKKYPGVMLHNDANFAHRVLDHIQSGATLPAAVHSAVKYNTLSRPAPHDLAGHTNASLRADAATKGTALSSYGASNDKELFATTVEHLARIKRTHAGGSILNRMPATARKTIKAFGASIRGERLPEGIVADIDRILTMVAE